MGSAWSKLASGQANVYAQYGGLFSILFFFITAAITGGLFYRIFGFIAGACLIFVEIPFCIKCCPTSEKFDGFVKSLENHLWRALMYIVLSIISFSALAVDGGYALFILPALSTLVAALCYGIAATKKEERDGVLMA